MMYGQTGVGSRAVPGIKMEKEMDGQFGIVLCPGPC